MATTDRQNRLLVAEDWRKIYQSFQQADFKSYDFETLRRTMVNYLKENYPDDFNDYVESSEYVALLDLIAYIAQALSFRIDLNARENFLETAERRNSILRLARLINYNARRNLPATGLLKVSSISTTQDDSANSNYREQFTAIFNAANQTGQLFGNPRESKKVGGINTEVYTLSTNQTDLPMFNFTVISIVLFFIALEVFLSNVYLNVIRKFSYSIFNCNNVIWMWTYYKFSFCQWS